MELLDCVVILSPLVLTLFEAIQVYVEITLLVKERLNVLPLQITPEFVVVIIGVGFTETVTTIGVPLQLFAVGVIV